MAKGPDRRGVAGEGIFALDTPLIIRIASKLDFIHFRRLKLAVFPCFFAPARFPHVAIQ